MTTRPASIDPLDFLDLDGDLSAEDRLLRQTVRSWVAERALPRLPDSTSAASSPRSGRASSASSASWACTLDGYGCAGASALAYGLACLELEAGDSGLRSFVSVQGSLAMFAIYRYGSEEQKARWLPRMAAGEAIGCFGLTEPDAGSDPAAMRTRAARDGDDWVLNGGQDVDHQRQPSPTSPSSGRRPTRASAGSSCPPTRRASRPPTSSGSCRCGASVTVRAGPRRRPAPRRRDPAAAAGLRAPLSCLNEARYGIVWGAVGAARACFESALAYSGGRVQFGRPIAGFQLTQAKLADMAAAVTTAGLLALRLARLKDSGRLRPEHVSMGKLNNARSALAVARTARTILGANGVTLEYPVMRHVANLETVLTYEGTHEIHALVVGRALTGISAFD